MRAILVTGRTIDQGRSLDIGKNTEEYYKSVAIVELDEEDMLKIGVKEGENVKITSKFGEVTVRVKKSRHKHPGIVFMPMGPWANQLTDPRTHGTGMPTLKSIEVSISRTLEKVLDIEQLLKEKFRVEPHAIVEKTPDPGTSSNTTTIRNVVCSFCGCLCDDLEVIISGNKIVRVRNACTLGASKIVHSSENRIFHPYIRTEKGLKEVSLEKAIKEAANILASSKYPLLYGWSNTSVEAMRVGLELAEYLGGVIDNTSTLCHGPSTLAVQEVGMVSSTLGQIRNYADLIVYWGCNPFNAHPRHPSRYSAFARGIYIKTRRERKIIVVDVRETDTSRIADTFLKIEPNKDYELASALRMIVKGYDIEYRKVAGIDVDKIYELADLMMSAKFGAIFYGLGVTMTSGKSRNIEELIKLVQDLNEWTKFVILPMRGHYNVTGANQSKLWITGYPYAVDFRRGYPRYFPGMTSTIDLLNNEEVDAALIVASDPIPHFPAKAASHLVKIPKITLDPKWSVTAMVSEVIIPTSIVGVECSGTAYRMDKVPLRTKKLIDPPRGVLSDEEVLRMLLKEVKALIR